MARHNIKHKKDAAITVIIPAAGEGRRMKSYGPKSLINLKTESVQWPLKLLRLKGY